LQFVLSRFEQTYGEAYGSRTLALESRVGELNGDRNRFRVRV